MSDISGRISLAESWFHHHIADGPGGSRGWGWVPDVPPNPQNTAEIVCALHMIGLPIPEQMAVEALVRTTQIDRSSNQSWKFEDVIDVAYRLRALICLGVGDGDLDVVNAVRAILATQDQESGGWRMEGTTGPVSTTATRAAVLALHALPDQNAEVLRAQKRAVGLLSRFVLQADDERKQQVYPFAQVADVLSRPSLSALGGLRTQRAKSVSLQRLRNALASGLDPVEEEVFARGAWGDSWRHTSLATSLLALSRNDSGIAFAPEFRGGMVRLLDLQQITVNDYNRGGFRTSREGFVTSFATAQALELLGFAATSVLAQVNPARTFDLMCTIDGAHHSDPQELLKVGRVSVMMNSFGGALMLLVCSSAGLTISVLALSLQHSLSLAASRALLVWGSALIAIGTYSFAALRYRRIPNRVVAAICFTAYTALALPVISYLLS